MMPFDLVLLPFPFTDLSTTKQRPGLILAAFHPKGLPEHYIIAMVTSQLTALPFPGDTLLVKWREAGLPTPSLVRLAKVVTIEHSLVRKKLGALHRAERKTIRSHFRSVFAAMVDSRRLDEGDVFPRSRQEAATRCTRKKDREQSRPRKLKHNALPL
jgi:mRNA interferase MazF